MPKAPHTGSFYPGQSQLRRGCSTNRRCRRWCAISRRPLQPPRWRHPSSHTGRGCRRYRGRSGPRLPASPNMVFCKLPGSCLPLPCCIRTSHISRSQYPIWPRCGHQAVRTGSFPGNRHRWWVPAKSRSRFSVLNYEHDRPAL